MSEVILVSACLLGLRTRYDGESRRCDEVFDFIRDNCLTAVPVCPEQLGGLPTPRSPASFRQGDGRALLEGRAQLINGDDTDVSSFFTRGAEQTIEIARLCNCRRALLKERSPSCGVHRVYRQDQLIPGQGVTAACLRQHAIEVFSEEDL